MFTKSHTMIIEKLGHRLSIIIVAFYSLITHHCLLITALIIPLFQVFQSQNLGVPDQNSRRSKSVPGPFQRNSRFCSKFVPSWFFWLFFSFSLKPFLKAWFARAFFQKLEETTLKLHQNYTEIDLKWARIARGMPRGHLEQSKKGSEDNPISPI